MYCKEYRFDEERFTILGHEFCKTCSSSESCEKCAMVLRGSHLTRSKGCTPTFDAKAILDRYFISHVFYL